MSLYGIETEDDCREIMDELLELNRRAEQRTNDETVKAVKSRLKEYYKIGDSERGRSRMSPIESQWFWPAIRDAYVKAPKLNSRRTWREGLSEIEWSLNYYRPKD